MATTKNQRRAAKKQKAKRRAENRMVPVPYFTRELLMDASRLGVEWDYNRQISREIADVPSGQKFPVTLSIEHNHRRMFRCEPHVRCEIMIRPGVYVFCDMPPEFYAKLPMTQIPASLATKLMLIKFAA